MASGAGRAAETTPACARRHEISHRLWHDHRHLRHLLAGSDTCHGRLPARSFRQSDGTGASLAVSRTNRDHRPVGRIRLGHPRVSQFLSMARLVYNQNRIVYEKSAPGFFNLAFIKF